MKTRMFLLIALLTVAGAMNPFRSSAQLTAPQILTKVDNFLNAPKDQELMTIISIIDKAGKVSTRTMSLLQKGSDKRLVKFLSPADQKGIGFLSLPNDNMTVYLPAFGKDTQDCFFCKEHKICRHRLFVRRHGSKDVQCQMDTKTHQNRRRKLCS